MGDGGEASAQSYQGDHCCGEATESQWPGGAQGRSWEGDCGVQSFLLQQTPQNRFGQEESDIQLVL